MNKLLLMLGTSTAIAVPVASVVACGPHVETREEKDQKVFSKMREMNELLVKEDFNNQTPYQHLNDSDYLYSNGKFDNRYNVELRPDDNKGMLVSGMKYTLSYVKEAETIVDYFKDIVAKDSFNHTDMNLVTTTDTENYNYYETQLDDQGDFETHRQDIKHFYKRAVFGPYVEPKQVDIKTDFTFAVTTGEKSLSNITTKADGTKRTDAEQQAFGNSMFSIKHGTTDGRYAPANEVLHNTITLVNGLTNLSVPGTHYDDKGNLKLTGNDRDQEVY